MNRPSVILVRECAEQLGGCCRIPQSSLVTTKQDPAFESQRAIIERMGAVYQALRHRFGRAIEVQVLDPRNIALPILLIRDFIKHRVGFRNGWRTLAQLPSTGIIVNGRIVDVSHAPDAGAVVEAVRGVVSPSAR
jgi:hypothetical protein